jgi:hypothetical protein
MQNTQDLINVLNEDLKNEYKHMLFYLHAGVRKKNYWPWWSPCN